MAFAKAAAWGVQAQVIVCAGDRAIIQVDDNHQLFTVSDYRPGFHHVAQKTTEVLVTYLDKGVAGLREKFGAENVQTPKHLG